jgi:hypothetical protein
MPERGETFFHLYPRHQSFDLPETKRTKPLEDNSAQERGGDVFPQNTKFPRVASISKQIIYRGSPKKETPFLFLRLPPGDDSLGRGEMFFKETQP